MELIAPRVFCVGTHHKTGTLWMRAVFRRLAAALGIESHVTYPARGDGLVPEIDRVFLFSWSSRFPEALLDRPDARVLHVIRDPRDVLLSGCRYHHHAPEAGEAFLHAPREDLGGLTYQQHLNALEDPEEKLLFEMREKHAQTLQEMLDWDYDRPNTIEARYEDLIADESCDGFREHLRDLGLTEPEVAKGVEIFWAKSLFGGLAEEAARGERIRAHVASGRVAQWREALPRRVAEAYAAEYGAGLVKLGYEPHPTAWLEELRDAA
ncbi:sulfotransferase family protein [Jannaschia ovalis]|uniref:Sulfotransferase domain-containing protein n=1 Tax=Jannaschia ovalis TaxID=3038773 RepID=A0ABY8LI50_9RHOB|nr:sulfotransferase domain-containing protein [Jannaschia sp. GRR-S6-38]WGH80073.1 sulfotransferase domain-containing protein [Jannaschia sp. GRR-S6-38]